MKKSEEFGIPIVTAEYTTFLLQQCGYKYVVPQYMDHVASYLLYDKAVAITTRVMSWPETSAWSDNYNCLKPEETQNAKGVSYSN